MTVLREFIESIKNTASTTAQIVFLITQLLRYTVCCLETDPPNIISEALRIVLYLLNTLFTIFLVYLGSIGRTYTMSLKEYHDVLYILLFFP